MQHNGGDLENMTAKLLEKHITDTIREWQVKIGYEGGTMKLYYPAESLRRSLSLDETEDLAKALAAFCKERTAAPWNALLFQRSKTATVWKSRRRDALISSGKSLFRSSCRTFCR